MKKIPTLFERNHDGDRLVRNAVTPGCEWVLAGEGYPTLKWDGSACLIQDGRLFKRYDRKPVKMKGVTVDNSGITVEWKWKPAPDGWVASQEPDEITGHWPGWVPVSETDPADQYHREAWVAAQRRFVVWDGLDDNLRTVSERIEHIPNGTYELVGTKINGNPHGFMGHLLIPHGRDGFTPDPPRDFDGLRIWFETQYVEGVVWWHEDGRRAKIKRRDFGLPWPLWTQKEEVASTQTGE